MPSPFPGMDPYAEERGWSTLRFLLLGRLRQVIYSVVQPRYWVAVEVRTYQETQEDRLVIPASGASRMSSGEKIPERYEGTATISRSVAVVVPTPVTIQERYLEVQYPGTGEVMTAIEVLSPENKQPGAGRDIYLEQRRQRLTSRTNLVEIDLQRGGERMPMLRAPRDYNYGVLVCSAGEAARSTLYPVTLRQPLPTFLLPLGRNEAPIPVDLNNLFHEAYDESELIRIIDYAQPPTPPLSPEDEAWADALLREKGLR